MTRKKIGEIAMSGKPAHAGHFGLINMASSECDEVHLHVSLSDRVRKGEIPVHGSDMAKIWHDHYEAILPSNVIIAYGGSPVQKVFQDIGEANESNSTDTYVIYADPQDLHDNFSENSLKKYAGNLFTSGQIILRAVERHETVDVSGTKMRSFIESGDFKSFAKNMPKGVDAKAIYDTLRASMNSMPAAKKKLTDKKTVGESLLREYVKRLISVL